MIYHSGKKIVLATPLYPPEIGGPATYAQALVEHLPKEEITLIKFSDVRHLPKIARHAVYFWRVYRAARRADVVFALDPVSVGLPAMLAAKLTRKKFVVRIPGDYAWEQGRQRWGVSDELEEFQAKKYGWQVELLRWVQKMVVRSARAVIVPSEYMKKIAGNWVSAERIHIIYSSIELPVETEEPRGRPEGFLICTIARLVPWKGIDGLIRVVAKEPSWRLVIVGEGPERAKMESIVRSHNASDRIRFVGQLPRAAALGWAKVSDVFVLNSTYEGLSHVLAEVLSLGIPTIATRIGGNPEIVRDGENGLLVEAGDAESLAAAIVSIQRDSRLKNKFAAAAPIFVQQHFSVDTSITKFLELLKTL